MEPDASADDAVTDDAADPDAESDDDADRSSSLSLALLPYSRITYDRASTNASAGVGDNNAASSLASEAAGGGDMSAIATRRGGFVCALFFNFSVAFLQGSTAALLASASTSAAWATTASTAIADDAPFVVVVLSFAA